MRPVTGGFSMPRHENLIPEVREWMRFAWDDLFTARGHLTGHQDAPWIVAYHAQQCAEKTLKAYLIFCGVQFPFTHSIAALRELVSEHAAWSEELSEADALTEFATSARYPGVRNPVTKERAKSSVECAIRVYERVRRALVEEGVAIDQTIQPESKQDRSF